MGITDRVKPALFCRKRCGSPLLCLRRAVLRQGTAYRRNSQPCFVRVALISSGKLGILDQAPMLRTKFIVLGCRGASCIC